MRDYFTEITYVLARSKRTQAALFLGFIFAVGICLLGEFYVSRLQFSGSLAGREQAFISELMKLYDKVALIALVSSWLVAFKYYRRDKRRFL